MGEEMHVVTYWTGILPETGAFLKVSKEKTNIFTICHRSLTHVVTNAQRNVQTGTFRPDH